MKIKYVFLFLFFSMTFSGFSQVQISGQLDVVLRNPNAVDNSNKTFINFSNYDFYRTRIFLDAKPAENVTVFTQILVDNGEFNLYGAYIRLSFFEELLNFHLGLIPNTVGIWGPRTYSDKNPFIAVPLVYNYHTSYALKGLDPGEDIFTTTPDGIIALKGKGYLFRGLPVLYDACWNSGLEIFGSYKMFDWSLAAISGSASYPARQPARDLPQVTTRLTYFPIAHINVSLSGYYGPYLNDEIIDILNVETGTVKSVNDFINSGVGVSFVYSGEYFEIFSEAFHSAWDHPFLGDLTASSSYVDLSYKFAPQWFGGIRGEIMRFSEVEGSLGKTEWDYPLNRYELVIGHKINRNVILKLDTQFSQYPDKKSINDHIYAIQVSTTF